MIDAPFSSSVIANYLLLKDKNLKNDIMKVLKLVYISHGFHLALTNGQPLIKENVMAWQYGPVIPELYFQLKVNTLLITPEEKTRFEGCAQLKAFLDIVYDKYKHLNGAALSSLTHKKGSPWDITVNNFHSQISSDLITDHYLGLLNKISA